MYLFWKQIQLRFVKGKQRGRSKNYIRTVFFFVKINQKFGKLGNSLMTKDILPIFLTFLINFITQKFQKCKLHNVFSDLIKVQK